MPGCILHVCGDDFRVDEFLVESSLQPYRIDRQGDISRDSQPLAHSGLRLNVSSADGDLTAEIADAIDFLIANEAELKRLRDFPGVSEIRFDFGYYRREVVAQFDYLPPDLLIRVGNLGIGIGLSLYETSESEA